MNGGALMALADNCGGICAFLNMPQGATGTATIESKTNFLRGVRDGEVRRRERFAAELRRVGRGWFVQTPARSFPIEPHSLLPGAHWLPPRVRRAYWRLGAARAWEDVALLGRAELERLFGPAMPERLGPFIKSWVCVRAVR